MEKQTKMAAQLRILHYEEFLADGFVVQRIPGESSTYLFNCGFCHTEMKTTTARAVMHLAGIHGKIKICDKITQERRAFWSSVGLKPEKDDDGASKRAKLEGLMPIAAAFSGANAGKEFVANALTEFVVANALPFRLVEDPYLISLAEALRRYPNAPLPNRRAVADKYLPAMNDRVLTANIDLIRGAARNNGSIIVLDGGLDRSSRPVINALVLTSRGPVFYDAIDTSGHTKDGQYIATIINRLIDDIGAESVVAVCTDSASNYKSAGALITAQYPTIQWIACGAHICDLFLKNMGSMPWAALKPQSMLSLTNLTSILRMFSTSSSLAKRLRMTFLTSTR